MKYLGRYFLPEAMAFLMIIAVSCSKQKPSYNRENLKGIWVADTYDGMLLDERKWVTYKYGAEGTVELGGVLTSGDGNYKWGSGLMSYEAYCCDVVQSGDLTGFFEIPLKVSVYQNYDIYESADSLVTLRLLSFTINKEEVPSDYNMLTMRKIPLSSSSSDSLVGIWQFATVDGQPFERYRLEFSAQKKVVFYVDDDGEWMATGGDEDYYNKYHDFLALTLYDNPYFGTPSYWDVACFSDLYASPYNSYMTFSSGNHVYTLTYVSSL